MAEEQKKTSPQKEEKPEQEKTEENQEVKPVTATIMIVVALLFDGIQALINLIPIAGQILSFLISIFAFLTFYLWFKMNGVSFAKPKRAGKLAGGFLVELIPILNILPAWTLAVFLIISETKIKKLVGQIPGGDLALKSMTTKSRNNQQGSSQPHTTPADKKDNKTQPNNKQDKKEPQKQQSGEAQKIEKEISEVRLKIDYLQKEAARLETQIATMNSNELLKQQSTGYFGKLNDMENRVRTMRSNIRTAAASLSELKLKRASLAKKQ